MCLIHCLIATLVQLCKGSVPDRHLHTSNSLTPGLVQCNILRLAKLADHTRVSVQEFPCFVLSFFLWRNKAYLVMCSNVKNPEELCIACMLSASTSNDVIFAHYMYNTALYTSLK